MADEKQEGAIATLAELKAKSAGMTDKDKALVSMDFNTVLGFEFLQRGANLLAASSLVPATFKGQVGNCVIALNMAARMKADPLMLMQNLYVVHGNPAWSAKFLIATFNQCGRFSAMRFEFSGTEGKDDWGCRAWAIENSTKEKLVGPKVTIAMAKAEGWQQKNGSKWQTMPEIMLTYRAASFFVKTHAPEISMGLQTAEEIRDGVVDLEPGPNGMFTTADLKTGPEPAPETEKPPKESKRGKKAAPPDPGPEPETVLCPKNNQQPVRVDELCVDCEARTDCGPLKEKK